MFLTHEFSVPPPVLPLLLVPTGGDGDGREAVVHEAESHRTGLRPEQLSRDQQVYIGLRSSLK